MEVPVNETITGIFPLMMRSVLLFIISNIISFIIKVYGDEYKKNKYEKIKYINFLTENFPLINSFLNAVISSKKKTSIIEMYTLNILYLGIFGGFLIEEFLATVIGDILRAILSINYIATLLISNTENFDILRLNIIILYSSFLNASYLIIFLVCACWVNSNKSRNLLTPLITKNGKVSSSAYHVFLSYWGFIGVTIGANIFVYFCIWEFT